MFLFPVTESEVEKVATDLKNKLSAGIDDIPDYVVKRCIQVLKKPLANIYNASLESGIFPDQLKVAKVIPLYNKGNKNDISNYRPIAQLSVFSKLLEKLMYNRLMVFIEGNEILTEAQHGLRVKKSTETALQFFVESTQETIEDKMNPVGIFLDLTKAYDVLSHKILLSKLNSYGIRGVANMWFHSYLSNRKQCVEVTSMKEGKYISTSRGLEYGVPQGSILGPVLFLLYINDLPLNITGSKIMLFADDTNILVSGENINILQCKIIKVMNELQTWFKLNNLEVNTEKTLAIPFHTIQNKKPMLPHIILEGRDVPYSIETKFLGIYINENMKWISHIKYLSSKLSTSYYMINSLKNVTSPYILRTMYFVVFMFI